MCKYSLYSSGLQHSLESNDLEYLKGIAETLIKFGYETRIRDNQALDYVSGYGVE